MRTLAAALLSTIAIAHAAEASTGSHRLTYTADSHHAGTTVPIPERDIGRLCADKDGCLVRFWLFDSNHHQKTTSTHSLLYYDAHQKRWHSESGSKGHSEDHQTAHVLELSRTCFFTDGEYSSNINLGDMTSDFGVLLWDRNVPGLKCSVTLID